MYKYTWDEETGGLLLLPELSKFSKEPRPVYYKELDILGFDKYWNYPKDDHAPLLWAEANNYIYKGRTIAKVTGGALYTPPGLVVLDKDPEPGGKPLEFVDVPHMCEKNRAIMEALVQETVQQVYQTYESYKSRIDVFYVAFSGGKDSVVALDMVQRALPHEAFKVVFGDTGMEFPDTYETVARVKAWCRDSHIEFLEARSWLNPLDSWRMFGPPASVTRWCCSVHKTAPQIILLRKLLKKRDFKGMAFVGVRGDESLARSKYEYITLGGKHKGQYSCNTILHWSSAEVFLHILKEHLVLNPAYKLGNRRAGCLICPRSSERSEFMNHHCYPEQAEPFVNIIREVYKNAFTSKDAMEEFIRNGGWKARKNGRDLTLKVGYSESVTKEGDTLIEVNHPRTDWKVWINTIGVLSSNHSPYVIQHHGKMLTFEVEEADQRILVKVQKSVAKEGGDFVKYLKNVFRKAASCVGCQECQADCPYGCLSFENGQVKVSENCRHCSQCHKVDKGCLIYKSLEQPKGGIVMGGKTMSLNSYSHHAPKMDWMEQYFKYKNTFSENHSLGSQMYSFFRRFLRDASLLDETGFSKTAELIDRMGLDSEASWGIIYINLCYAPQLHWYVTHTGFNEEYSKAYLGQMMIESGAKENWVNDIFSSLTRMSELPLGDIGLGHATREKNRVVSLTRNAWLAPDSLTILYSLYKFAEACGGYYQFSLSTLLDDSIERDGVSPTRIFGLGEDEMKRILNGLSSNYPDFISASFTLDLDNITLRSEKTVDDVLQLF